MNGDILVQEYNDWTIRGPGGEDYGHRVSHACAEQKGVTLTMEVTLIEIGDILLTITAV